MKKFWKLTFFASVIAGVANILIQNICIFIAGRAVVIQDIEIKILFYNSVAVALLVVIEGLLFLGRKSQKISLRGVSFREDASESEASEGVPPGLLWAISVWLFPVFFTKMYLSQLGLEFLPRMPPGEIDLGMGLVPYVAFRTFLDWRLYWAARKSD